MAKSKAEAALDSALVEVFGPAVVTTEMPVKVFGKTLYVDRVLQGYKIAFEVDGRQHDEYVEFFHRDRDGFMSAKERDRLKKLWLGANGYKLVRFKHTEKITAELVRKRVSEALDTEDNG